MLTYQDAHEVALAVSDNFTETIPSYGEVRASATLSSESQRQPRQRYGSHESIPRFNIRFPDPAFFTANPSLLSRYNHQQNRQANIYFPEFVYKLPKEEIIAFLTERVTEAKANMTQTNPIILHKIYQEGRVKTQYPKAASIKEAHSLA